MQRLFSLCAISYLMIYAFEGVIRYGLYNIGASDAILLRDGLILGPLVLLLVAQVARTRVHPAFFAFGAIIGLHGLVSTLNFHNVFPAMYGAVLLLNVLFGFIAARSLVLPNRRVVLLLGTVWVISVVAVVLDKFFVTFPWTGLETHIGGISVDVSRGWDISDGFDKRAAGFTRSSICAAMLLPTIALIIALRIRSYLLRTLMLFMTVAAVFMTTQKGAVVAIAAVAMILATPRFMRYRLLCWAALGFAILDVALPIFTYGLMVTSNGGVFSMASFGMRIADTWPDAWRWISDHNLFPFGVGLGGIGGAQRWFAPDFFNPSDNLFVYLYANFGVLTFFYLGWALWQAWHQPPETQSIAITPLAILVFMLGYGAALSMLEDQVSELFFGASVGMLWMLRQMAAAKPWANPYWVPPDLRYGPAITYKPVRSLPAADVP
ncbi:MAG TPA: hypothetical protein VMU81_11395 [Acetobacteraceae bacterium]|nr:hypothetical protein [Acetobacteraceae bacterium]